MKEVAEMADKNVADLDTVDPGSGLWVNREEAVSTSLVLSSAPVEYIDVLPWQRGPDGDQWISHADLARWTGDGDFYARASAVIQANEDAEYRRYEATR